MIKEKINIKVNNINMNFSFFLKIKLITIKNTLNP